MSALAILRTFARSHPQAAAVVFGAVACFAGVAVILGIGIDPQAGVPNVIYVLAVGALLAVVVRIVNDAILMRVLAWFVAIMAMGWVIVFVLYLMNPKDPRLACLARPLRDCAASADAVAAATAPPLPPLDRPAAGATSVPGVDPGRYAVSFQFAGLVRDRVRSVMEQVAQAGWRVQGVPGGGDRTGAAAGLAEVRYGPTADAEAATALARLVQASNLTGKGIRAVQVRSVQPDTLEVWVSL